MSVRDRRHTREHSNVRLVLALRIESGNAPAHLRARRLVARIHAANHVRHPRERIALAVPYGRHDDAVGFFVAL